MADLTNTAEGGTAGTQLTAIAQTGAAGSGTQFSQRSWGTNTVVKWQTGAAHGSLCYEFANTLAGSSEVASVTWNMTGPSVAAKFYLKITAYPGTQQRVMDIRNSATSMLRVLLNTNGTLTAQDGGGTNQWTSTGNIPINTWVRIDAYAAPGTTTANGALGLGFATLDSALTAQFTTATANTGTTNAAFVQFGKTVASTWTDTFWLDTFEAIDGQTAFVGPESIALTASADLTGAGSLAATGTTPKFTVPAALSGSGSVAATTAPKPAVAATLSGSGALTSSATPKPTVAAALNGSGAISAATTPKPTVTAAAGGSGALAATGSKSVPGAATALFTGSGTLAATSIRGGQVGVPVPAFFDPTTLPAQWDALLANYAGVPFIIINPATGPGTVTNSTYATRIAQVRAAGIKVVGYVNTNYGGIASATVDTDIDTWHTLYPTIDGIYFALTDGATATVSYYQARAAKARSYGPSQMVVTNPAWWPTDEAHIALADTVMVFENTYATLLSTPEAWYPGYTMTGTYPATRFWWSFYAVPGLTEAQEVLRRARAWKIGYVYVTDDATPYDALPTYWPDFLTAAAAPSTTATATAGLDGSGALAATAAQTSATATAALSGSGTLSVRGSKSVAGAFTGSGALAATAARGGPVGAPVPAYFDPTTLPGQWDALFANHTGVPFIIVDPASGPGAAVNANYASRIVQAQTAGIKVVGYVNTQYGGIAAATVDTDIDTWHSLYPSVDGIFFDLTDGTTTTLPYFQARAAKVRSYGSSQMVVTNPGWWPTDEGHIALADVVMVFENTYATLLSTPESWYPSYTMSGAYLATRFWWCFYAVPSMTEAQEVLRRARAWRIGYVYVTDDTTPYDALPTYWPDFLAAAALSTATTVAAGLGGSGALAAQVASSAGLHLRGGSVTTLRTGDPLRGGSPASPVSVSAGLSGSGALTAARAGAGGLSVSKVYRIVSGAWVVSTVARL